MTAAFIANIKISLLDSQKFNIDNTSDQIYDANHFNNNNPTANDIRSRILKGHFRSNKEIQLCEQKLIVKNNCLINGLNKDK